MGESELDHAQKPITGPQGQTFESFDACVAAMSDEEGIDDPEAFCAWLEEEGKEALSDPNAQEVLAGLEVEFVSAVDEPAQDSEWVIAKDSTDPDGDRHRWQTEVTLYVAKSKDEDGNDREKQVAFAPVLIPKEADKQGDVIPTPAIEDAAHRYLAEYRKVDSDHDLRDGKGTPVESWTLKQDTSFEKPDGTESRTYPEGTWVMGIKFDDETWERVKAGELSGLSIYGGAKPVDVDALLGKDSAGTERGAIEMTKDTDESHESVSKQGVGTYLSDVINDRVDSDDAEGDVVNAVASNSAFDQDTAYAVLNGEVECPDFDLLEAFAEVLQIDAAAIAEAAPDSCDYDQISMSNEDDPGDAGNDGQESTSKQDLSADQVSTMLAEFGSMVEDGSVSADATVKEFVQTLIENGAVDEGEVRNLSVLLTSGGSTGGGDGSPSDEGETAEGSDDDGIDLDAGKSDDGDDAAKDTDGDTDTDTDGDVDKSVDDGGDVFDDAPEWAQALKSEVDDLREKVDDPPAADRMESDDELSDRLVKDITGVDDADVARKAIREQVEKSDGDSGPTVDYDGITEDEDATAEASSTDDGGSLHSAAANSRMVGGDN